MPPLCVATTENKNLENKGIEEAGWSLEQHHQPQAISQQSSAAAWDRPHNLEGSWKASVTSTGASTEKARGREVNKGMLVSGSRDSLPKGKKEENACVERTGVLSLSLRKQSS